MFQTRQLAQNTLIQIVGKIVSTIVGLVIVGLMTRYLGQEKFGWYFSAISFLQFIGILTDFGLTPVTAQMLAADDGKTPRLLANLLGFRLTTASISFCLAPLLALFLPYPTPIKIAIAITAVSFIAIAMNQVLLGYYQKNLRMHVHTLGEIAGRVVLLIGTFLLVEQNRGFLPLMMIISVSSLIFFAILWIGIKEKKDSCLAFDLEIWKRIIKTSWPITISIICNVVYLRGDALLLPLFRSQSEIGIYGAAYRVLDVLTQAAMMLMGLFLPLLSAAWAGKNKTAFRTHYQQSFDTLMLFALPTTIGILMTASSLMRFIAGDEFASSGTILRILVIAVFGVYLGALFGHTAVAISRQKQTMWVYGSNAVITLIGYLIFIPRYGIYGAAGMTVFSECYTGLFLFLTLRRYHDTPLRLNRFLKILFASLIMAAPLYLFHTWPVVWLILLAITTYTACLFIFKVFTLSTLNELFGFKPKL